MGEGRGGGGLPDGGFELDIIVDVRVLSFGVRVAGKGSTFIEGRLERPRGKEGRGDEASVACGGEG